MLVGNVASRTAILIDDIADTSGTITRAAALLSSRGATKIYALITHAILSGDALKLIQDSHIDELIVSNSIPQREHVEKCNKIKVFDTGAIFAEAIRRIHHGESVNQAYDL